MSKLKKTLILAILSGAGAVLGIIESMLPLLPAIPGGKLGLANIVTVVALYIFGGWECMLISVVRAVISSALYGGFNAFVYSLAGGVFSALVMTAVYNLFSDRVSPVGVSVCGAASHNTAQVAVAWLVVRSNALLPYLGILLAISLVSGICTGFVIRECVKRIDIKVDVL